MCILLKLQYPKFDVSRLFCSNVIKENLWGVGSPPPPLAKERVKQSLMFLDCFGQMLSKKAFGGSA